MKSFLDCRLYCSFPTQPLYAAVVFLYSEIMQDTLFQVALTYYSSVCPEEIQLIVVVTILLLLLHVTDHMCFYMYFKSWLV